MKVVLAQTAGFCMGVKRAMTMVRKEIESSPGPFYTYGPLIHNPQALDELAKQGITVLDTIPRRLEGTVVIRTHGIPPAERRRLVDAGARICDATCPKVMRTHSIVKRHAEAAESIVIIGDRGHAEVLGLAGTAGGRGVVVSSPGEAAAAAERLQAALPAAVCIVAQTTLNHELFERIIARFKKKLDRITVYETICSATEERQREVRSLSAAVQAMIIVGGYGSANTTRLAALAESTGVPTYHVEQVDELQPEWFESVEIVGVMAGASTPTWITEEVVQRLSRW